MTPLPDAVAAACPASLEATVPPTCRVASADWLAAATALVAAGAAYLDFLSAVDRPDRAEIELVAHVARPADWERLLLAASLPRDEPTVASLVPVYAGAAWHERETAEMFGVEFEGLDARRLLTSPGMPAHPLRKDTVLVARQVQEWPGRAEPGGAPARRRTPAPGVVPDWLREDPA